LTKKDHDEGDDMSRPRSGHATVHAAVSGTRSRPSDCEEVLDDPTTITIMRSSGETIRVRPMEEEEEKKQEAQRGGRKTSRILRRF
jgi:hypothetical protein